MSARARRGTSRCQRKIAARGRCRRLHLCGLRCRRNAARAPGDSVMNHRLPNFAALDFDALTAEPQPTSVNTSDAWDTPEGIRQKGLYTAADLAEVAHLGTLPG